MQHTTRERETFDRVLAALVSVDERISRRRVSAETSITDDLALDSLRFVDLAVALEDAFGVSDFPLQDWYDAESSREGTRYTMGSLVALCIELTQHRSGSGA